MASQMEFWGVEVKPKQACPVAVDDSSVIHLSQATLGELKKDNEPVIVHVKVGDKKLVLGMLSQNNPQLSFDLVFEKDFEISHNWKNGSVHLLGYQTELGDFSDEEGFESSDEEDEFPVPKENGKPAAPAPAAAKAAAAAAAKPNSGKPEDDDESDDDDDDDSEDDSEDLDSDEEMVTGDDDDDDSEEEQSEEETPAKAEAGKKRPNANAKTPESKKVKLATPQKTDGKKGAAHSATPHPAKKGAKTPATDKSPKSAGQVSCGSCKKTFNSDKALESHSKAKHGTK